MACKIGILPPVHVLLLMGILILSGHDIKVVKGGEGCIESERRSLLAIKADMYDPDAWLSSWTGRHCCSWRGVGCDNATGHVVKLDLRYPYQQPEGPSTLNPSLHGLTHLRYLDLSMNNFAAAPIPDSIRYLVNLEYLNLHSTLFSGTVPRWLGNLSSLNSLDLGSGSSSLRADDLRWLSGIPSLIYLDMTSVDLSEASDDWVHRISVLPSLSELTLSRTGLSVIPTTLQHVNFTSLTTLDLSLNNFQSAIPTWLVNLSSLAYLNLGDCGFHGEIPFSTGYFSHMRVLSLRNNQLGASVLELLGNLSQLAFADLSSNALSGPIPENLGRLSQLEYLDLSSNRIEGSIPRSVGNLSHLKHLDWRYNQIAGEIPETLWSLSMLEYLSLSSNRIGGEMAESMSNLSSLVELDLSLNRITGQIPTTIGALVSLQSLWISSNFVDGEIPESIGNLSRLQRLELNDNNISGGIPETLGNLHDLNHLDLSVNRINGRIPQSIGNLINLVTLRMMYNRIDGEIPDPMGNLCKLFHLNLSNNKIRGTIAPLLEGLSKCMENKNAGTNFGLQLLILSGNNLSGTVPPSLGQLSKLIDLDLSSNSLEGALTEAHFANLTKLDGIYLSHNYLEIILSQDWVPPFNASFIALCSSNLGQRFPTWLRSQTKLTTLRISEAGITDDFPWWSFNHDLQFLNLSHNNMKGPLPPSLERYKFIHLDLRSNSFVGPIPNINPSRLQVLNLSNNSLSGPIPSSFSSGVALKFLILSKNRLDGSFPSCLCNMTSLQVLDVSNNELHGTLPQCRSEMLKLVTVDFSNNGLSGNIPETIGSLTHLRSLHLSNNGFSGNIPQALERCRQLITLDLGENRLSGSIPTWLGRSLSSLKVLRLRSNQFSGSIPIQLSYLTSLQVLDLADNKFVGRLSLTFTNFSAMIAGQVMNNLLVSNDTVSQYYTESLFLTTKGIEVEYTSVLSAVTSIDLSGNSLSGEIPTELTQLVGLLFLNLSKNHLTGKIPGDIGSLQQLESLDLSVNNLSGAIPFSMSSLHFLSHLNLSINKLSGRIPTGNQIQTFDDISIYKGNPDLCGWPLPQCHGDGHSHKSEQEGYLDTLWFDVSTMLGFGVGYLTFFGTIMIISSVSMSSLHFLSHLNLSINKLSGRIPTGDQIQTFDDISIYKGNPDLCGWPLPQCHGDGYSHVSGQEGYLDTLWIDVSTLLGFGVGYLTFFGTIMIISFIRYRYFHLVDNVSNLIYVKFGASFDRLTSEKQRAKL